MGRRIVQQGDEVYATRTVDVSRDGRHIVVGRHSVDAPPRLEVLDRSDLHVVEQWGAQLGHDATLARFIGDDGRLLVADFAGRVVWIDRQSGAIQTISVSPRARAVAASRHAARAAVVAEGAVVLDVATGEAVWNVSESYPTTRDAEALALSADGARLAVADWEARGIAVLDVEARTVSRVMPWSPHGTRVLSFAPDGRYLSLVGTGGSAIWDVKSGARVLAEKLNEKKIAYTCSAFHPSLPCLLIGSHAGYVSMFDLATSAWKYAEKVHDGSLWDMVVADDGSLVVSAGDEGDVYLQDWADMEAIGMSRMG